VHGTLGKDTKSHLPVSLVVYQTLVILFTGLVMLLFAEQLLHSAAA
jgi:hypothetical protein